MAWVEPFLSSKQNPALTLKHGEPLGLVVVDDGYADGVQADEAEHYPVEAVRLDHTADGEA